MLALGIKAVFLVLAVFDNATMWMAVFADMGASLLVVFNGLRLLRVDTTDRGALAKNFARPEAAAALAGTVDEIRHENPRPCLAGSSSSSCCWCCLFSSSGRQQHPIAHTKLRALPASTRGTISMCTKAVAMLPRPATMAPAVA